MALAVREMIRAGDVLRCLMFEVDPALWGTEARPGGLTSELDPRRPPCQLPNYRNLTKNNVNYLETFWGIIQRDVENHCSFGVCEKQYSMKRSRL